MTNWYKMNPVDWNDGTTDLSLEQEAAYLRICHAIYMTERAIPENWFVIAGLLRCSDRKAKRLVAELVTLGKLVIEDGHISNRRAMDEVSTRRGVSVDRSSAGRRGGVESGKSRAKTLKSNETGQAIASGPNEPEEIRVEENRKPPNPLPQKRFANPSVVLQSIVDPMTAQQFVGHLEEKRRPLSSQSAEMMVETLREVVRLGGNPADALKLAIKKGWVSVDIEYLRNAGFKFTNPAAASDGFNWPAALELFRKDPGNWASGWGPKPGEPGCRVPAELLTAKAA